MRLIDADKLYPDCFTRSGKLAISQSQIAEAPTVDTTCPNCDSGYAQGYSDGYLKGKEERPQGHWIKVDDNVRSQCSECGFKYADYRILFNFCPNCGADMRKEAENDN